MIFTRLKDFQDFFNLDYLANLDKILVQDKKHYENQNR